LKDYYSEKLSAERLRKAYELSPPRAKQYLEAEIRFVLDKIHSRAVVLELGCGYGRVLERLTERARRVIGIDTSLASLMIARRSKRCSGVPLATMDALHLGFPDQCFDLVVCIQNGISAFNVDQEQLVREALRVTRSGGKILFSSYSEHFWEDRLDWFRMQSKHGLLGDIDEEATGDGVIVCKDGFRATTLGPEDFMALASKIGIHPKITEVDGSSIFCEMDVKK